MTTSSLAEEFPRIESKYGVIVNETANVKTQISLVTSETHILRKENAN